METQLIINQGWNGDADIDIEKEGRTLSLIQGTHIVLIYGDHNVIQLRDFLNQLELEP